MKYNIEFKPRAVKDLKSLPSSENYKILEKIEYLRNDLGGDVKKLTNHTPEYRLRIGNLRVLFEVDGDNVIIYRIKHRKESYR